MQQFSDDFLQRWEHIIADVTTTDVPIECIKKIVVKLTSKKQKTVNLAQMRKQGLDWKEIETVVSRILAELGDTVSNCEFVLDVAAVAQIVQPETDKILRKL